MDKYNIISMTTDIDELKADMANWCMLPYELRMRSIDDCRRLYNGMSVIDLYNHLKDTILRHKDIRSVEPDNLVRESVATDYDNYDNLLAQSKELQKSPYIVILDPDIKDIDELNNKYYSYYLLNDNNKQLSDTYSWKIWGRNIYSMYMTLAAQIQYNEGEGEADSSNLIKVDESNEFAKISQAVDPVNDFYNEALMDKDIVSMCKYKLNLISEKNSVSRMLESMVVAKDQICKERKFDHTILPSCVPWFTACENADMEETIDIHKFYSILKTALKNHPLDSSEYEKEVLGLGWNPSVPLNTSSIHYAKERQANFFNNVDIINIKNFKVPEGLDVYWRNEHLYPVLFFFGYDSKPDHINQTLPNYNKVGVAFKENITRVYTFDGVDNTFKGFKIEGPFDYLYLDIVVFYMDKESYLKLLTNIANINNEKYMKINFNSIFQILNNTVNKLSPDNMKIIYSRYINMLLKITNIDDSENVPELKQFATMNNKLNIYKVYSGRSAYLDRETFAKIFEKLKAISDNQFLTSSVIESLGCYDNEDISNYLIDRMTPVACIKHIN